MNGQRVTSGILAGLAGGVVFGVMMPMMTGKPLFAIDQTTMVRATAARGHTHSG